MKKEIADQWVAALRSGKYKQGKSRLRFKDDYCCLGVLCDLKDNTKWQPNDNYDIYDQILPPEVQSWADMKTKDGLLNFTPFAKNTLASLNDEGKSFETIADIIEKEWERL